MLHCLSRNPPCIWKRLSKRVAHHPPPDCACAAYAAAAAAAADYAAFDVDVTTADPGDAALAGVGQKVLIGGHSGDWYGNAGGVAYVSSFGTPGMPCFVFPRNLGPNYAKYVWEAASHELGHTLGLFHDGLTPNPAPGALYPDGTYYYSGHGNWAPIMVSASNAYLGSA